MPTMYGGDPDGRESVRPRELLGRPGPRPRRDRTRSLGISVDEEDELTESREEFLIGHRAGEIPFRRMNDAVSAQLDSNAIPVRLNEPKCGLSFKVRLDVFGREWAES